MWTLRASRVPRAFKMDRDDRLRRTLDPTGAIDEDDRPRAQRVRMRMREQGSPGHR